MAQMARFRNAALATSALAIGLALPGMAAAQTAPADNAPNEIIVTAQKREQSVNSVPITITAATGEQLRDRGIRSVADLPLLVPGFTVQESAFNSTSFTLRGIGFFNSDLATPPAVTIYLDEAPIPYPGMTKLTAFDLERVEVLKGPQGTLFGQNATGGLVNYIAAKPSDHFTAGLDLDYGRFNRVTLGGFVSGPLSDSLSARLALQGRHGDAWQYSITRPGDKLGRIRELQGRATLDFHPEGRLTSRLTFTATHDGSDNVASQFIGAALVIPALAPPGLATFPVVTKPRAADWTPVRSDTGQPFPYRSDTNLYSLNWRNDYELSDTVKLTSLTAFSHFKMAYGQDTDGTPFHINEVIDRGGRVNSFFQEVRLSGKSDKFNWLIGANYTHDIVKDAQLDFFVDKDVCSAVKGIDPQAFCDSGLLKGHLRVNTYGIYGRVEYNFTSALSVEAALRYNDDHRSFNNCAITTTDHFARYFNIFQSIFNGGQPIDPLTVGRCYVLDPANNFRPVTSIRRKLNEDNVSWRVGLNWKPQRGLLVYANASKGYKAGTVPVVGAATTNQFAPVKQESVLAFEAGFKAGLLDRRLQLNGALFYYDYRDKQLRGSLLDPAFGPLEALVSIPKSRVYGAEAQIVARPINGLTIDSSLTYVNTKIQRFTGFDAFANFGNQAGTPFPFSPKWQSVTDVSYEFPLSSSLDGFVGGSMTYNSKTFSGVGALPVLTIGSFTLFDARAGVETSDGRYRLWVWGKNIANKYYWNNVFAYGNTISRYVGSPATYGVSLSYRFR